MTYEASGRTVGAALAAAREAGVDRLDAQLWLAHLLQCPRSWLLAHDESVLPARVAVRFDEGIARRAAGEPLAYLVGHKEFHGLELAVDARALVPRPETEGLVDWALSLAPPRATVVDLGTGTGAIALAMGHRRPDLEILAVDRSAEALALAASNGRRLGIRVVWQQSDWWSALGDRRVDLAVANPPYIASGDTHLAALQHEPQQALVAGADGLDDLRHLIAEAPAHLSPGAWMLVEHGWDQAEAVRRLFAAAGFGAIETRPDLAGHPRCTGGRLLNGAGVANAAREGNDSCPAALRHAHRPDSGVR